jgi:hypothetical protein
LVVLTYRHNELVAIYSSTPSVQFVRLDLETEPAVLTQEGDISLSTCSRQLTVPALHELPDALHRVARQAFRNS